MSKKKHTKLVYEGGVQQLEERIKFETEKRQNKEQKKQQQRHLVKREAKF